MKTVPFQTIQFSISTQLKCQTVPSQPIQFSKSTQFSSIWSVDRTLSGTTTPSQSSPGSDCNEGLLRILQIRRITATLLSVCLVLCPGYSWLESYPSAEKQLVYSTAPAEWASNLQSIRLKTIYVRK